MGFAVKEAMIKSNGKRLSAASLRLDKHVSARQVNFTTDSLTESLIKTQSKPDVFSTFDFRLAHQFPMSHGSISEERKRVRKRLERRDLATLFSRSLPRFLRSCRELLPMSLWSSSPSCMGKNDEKEGCIVRLGTYIAANVSSFCPIR
jgi:hypothetical protein